MKFQCLVGMFIACAAFTSQAQVLEKMMHLSKSSPAKPSTAYVYSQTKISNVKSEVAVFSERVDLGRGIDVEYEAVIEQDSGAIYVGRKQNAYVMVDGKLYGIRATFSGIEYRHTLPLGKAPSSLQQAWDALEDAGSRGIGDAHIERVVPLLLPVFLTFSDGSMAVPTVHLKAAVVNRDELKVQIASNKDRHTAELVIDVGSAVWQLKWTVLDGQRVELPRPSGAK